MRERSSIFGETATHALKTGSPAIDTIPEGSAGCGTIYPSDQRGSARPNDGDVDGALACDSGAYEKAFSALLLLTDNPDPSQAAGVFSVSFSLTTTAPALPTGLVTVSVEGSASSCSAALENSTGQCQLQIETPGTYTLTAVYSGDQLFDSTQASQAHTVSEAPSGHAVYLPVLSKNTVSP